MTSRSMDCCGTKELVLLSTHYSPFTAMLAFVSMWKNGEDHSGFRAANSSMYSNYIFTAAIYDREVCEKTSGQHTHLLKGKLWDKKLDMYFPYGHYFAEFIEKNKLGKVVTLDSTINAAFHPDHKVQAWLWQPDPKAIQKWADDNAFGLLSKGGIVASLDKFMGNILSYDKGLVMHGPDYVIAYEKAVNKTYTEVKTKLDAVRKGNPKTTIELPKIPLFNLSF